MVQDTQTCGVGLAEHATIPAAIATMLDGLAETLELHRRMLAPDDPGARKEDEVYRDLAARWRQISELVAKAAAQVAAQRGLPMGAHDPAAWGEEHRRALEKFVNGQTSLLALLRVAAERDREMLTSMQKQP